MSEHPPYDPDRPCPKCGNPICITEFRRGHRGINAGFHWGDFGDRMVRRCGRCEHSWYELPADHDDAAEQAAIAAWLESAGVAVEAAERDA